MLAEDQQFLTNLKFNHAQFDAQLALFFIGHVSANPHLLKFPVLNSSSPFFFSRFSCGSKDYQQNRDWAVKFEILNHSRPPLIKDGKLHKLKIIRALKRVKFLNRGLALRSETIGDWNCKVAAINNLIPVTNLVSRLPWVRG